jgi:hypothetical protein
MITKQEVTADLNKIYTAFCQMYTPKFVVYDIVVELQRATIKLFVQ